LRIVKIAQILPHVFWTSCDRDSSTVSMGRSTPSDSTIFSLRHALFFVAYAFLSRMRLFLTPKSKAIYGLAVFRNLSDAGPRFAMYRVGSRARLDSRCAETETINLARFCFALEWNFGLTPMTKLGIGGTKLSCKKSRTKARNRKENCHPVGGQLTCRS
jgi:hypothetical protein